MPEEERSSERIWPRRPCARAASPRPGRVRPGRVRPGRVQYRMVVSSLSGPATATTQSGRGLREAGGRGSLGAGVVGAPVGAPRRPPRERKAPPAAWHGRFRGPSGGRLALGEMPRDGREALLRAPTSRGSRRSPATRSRTGRPVHTWLGRVGWAPADRRAVLEATRSRTGRPVWPQRTLLPRRRNRRRLV